MKGVIEISGHWTFTEKTLNLCMGSLKFYRGIIRLLVTFAGGSLNFYRGNIKFVKGYH